MSSAALQTLLGFALTALCWGFTNPFIRRGSRGLEAVQPGRFGLGASQTLFLFSRWQYVLPLAVNLCGSVVYYHTLGQSDLTLAVPVANALTFLCTTFAGYLLGEDSPTPRVLMGSALITAGLALCVADSVSRDTSASAPMQ